MNPYDAPASQPRPNTRRVWFLLAITLLVLFGITAVLVLGVWARKEARMDRSGGNIRHRSGGNIRRSGPAIPKNEGSLKRNEQSSINETPQDPR